MARPDLAASAAGDLADGSAQRPTVRVGVATVAAMGGSLVIALARFAYAPLQPALVTDGWFSGSQAALLAAANLGGYLIGALLAARLSRRFGAAKLLRITMLIVSISFLACAVRWFPFAWFLLWRVASGVGGGLIMALAGPAVLSFVAVSRRAFVSQMVLFGLAIGIVIAGSLMPLLISGGIVLAWIVLGIMSLLITAVTWRMWPPSEPARAPAAKPAPERAGLFCVQYALAAFGVVPQMVFLVDFVARDLDRGVNVGSHFYLVYGVGAVIGPFAYAALAERVGIRAWLRCALVVQFVAITMLSLWTSTGMLIVSSFLAGLGMPGLIALFLVRSQQITGGDPMRHRVLWGKATAAFAAAQASAAFGTSALLGAYGEGGIGYPILFAVGSVAMALAFVLDFFIRK